MTYINPGIKRTIKEVAQAKKRGDVTANGVAYFTNHSKHRFDFTLAREEGHTDDDLHIAKIELREGRESITLRVERFDR